MSVIWKIIRLVSINGNIARLTFDNKKNKQTRKHFRVSFEHTTKHFPACTSLIFDKTAERLKYASLQVVQTTLALAFALDHKQISERKRHIINMDSLCCMDVVCGMQLCFGEYFLFATHIILTTARDSHSYQ